MATISFLIALDGHFIAFPDIRRINAPVDEEVRRKIAAGVAKKGIVERLRGEGVGSASYLERIVSMWGKLEVAESMADQPYVTWHSQVEMPQNQSSFFAQPD